MSLNHQASACAEAKLCIAALKLKRSWLRRSRGTNELVGGFHRKTMPLDHVGSIYFAKFNWKWRYIMIYLQPPSSAAFLKMTYTSPQSHVSSCLVHRADAIQCCTTAIMQMPRITNKPKKSLTMSPGIRLSESPEPYP